LENAIRQLVLLGPAEEIDEAAVYRMISGTEIAVETDGASQLSAGLGDSESDAAIEPLWITEKKAIEAAIAACDGSVNRAAKQLQVAPSTIYRKIQSWKSQ
jgi:two-component system repressor protein LuxO